MQIEYALEIETQTDLTNVDLGLQYGVFRFVTGSQSFVSVNAYFCGFLLRDGFSEISKTIDINDSGAYATLSMFSAKLANTSGLSNYLRENQIFLQNCDVRFFVVVDGELRPLWAGVIDEFPWDDNTLTVECVDSSRKIHKSLPISQANDSEMVPVALGRNLSTRLVEERSDGETLEECGVVPFEGVTMSAVSPVDFEGDAMRVYVGSFAGTTFITEDYFKGFYATCISGRGKGLSRKVIASSAPQIYVMQYNKIPNGYRQASAVVRLTFDRPWQKTIVDEETGEAEWEIDLSPRINNTEYFVGFVGGSKSYLTFSKRETTYRASEFPILAFDWRDSLTTKGIYTDKTPLNGLNIDYQNPAAIVDSVQIDDDGKTRVARIEKPNVKFSIYSVFDGVFGGKQYYSRPNVLTASYSYPIDPMRPPVESSKLVDEDLTSAEDTRSFEHKCFGDPAPYISFADTADYTPAMFGAVPESLVVNHLVSTRIVFQANAFDADEYTPSMAGKIRLRWGAAVDTISLSLQIDTAVFAIAKDGRTKGYPNAFFEKLEGSFTKYATLNVDAEAVIDGYRYGSISVNSFSPESLFGKSLDGICFYNEQLQRSNLITLEDWIDRIDYRCVFRVSGAHSQIIGVAFDLQEVGLSIVERTELKDLRCGTWGETWRGLSPYRKTGAPQSPEDLIEYVMRGYDGITTIDEPSFDGVKTNLQFAQQITTRTETIDLLINLLEQSFLMLTMNRNGDRKLTDWMANKTPIANHSTAGFVVAKSFSGIERVPLSQVYTEIKLEYDWDGSTFTSICLVTKTDQSEFPAVDGDWKSFVSGGSLNWAQAKIIWDRFAAAYKRVKKRQDVPAKLSQSRWLRHNTTDKSDSVNVFNYLNRLSSWVTIPREIIRYRIPVEFLGEIDVGSAVSFEDVILTGGVARVGWITELRFDPIAAQVELTVLLDNDPFDPYVGEETYIDEDTAPLDSWIDEEEATGAIDEDKHG